MTSQFQYIWGNIQENIALFEVTSDVHSVADMQINSDIVDYVININ